MPATVVAATFRFRPCRTSHSGVRCWDVSRDQGVPYCARAAGGQMTSVCRSGNTIGRASYGSARSCCALTGIVHRTATPEGGPKAIEHPARPAHRRAVSRKHQGPRSGEAPRRAPGRRRTRSACSRPSLLGVRDGPQEGGMERSVKPVRHIRVPGGSKGRTARRNNTRPGREQTESNFGCKVRLVPDPGQGG
jgi:hypothetical protein